MRWQDKPNSEADLYLFLMTRSEKGVFFPQSPGLGLLPWEDFILKAWRISPLVHLRAADKWAALLWLGFVPPQPQMAQAANERGEAGRIDLRDKGFPLILPSPAPPSSPLTFSPFQLLRGTKWSPSFTLSALAPPPEGFCCGLTPNASKPPPSPCRSRPWCV